jgi:D-alanine-D-alanine ligase
MKRKLKVMLLVHPQMRPDLSAPKGATEVDVWRALKNLGYQVQICGLRDDLTQFDAELSKLKPDVVFNLLEEFRDEGVFDFHAVSYLEALGIPYTGCNPRGLIVSRNKSWAVQIARGLEVASPETFVKETNIKYPAFVKFVREHASRGLTERSRVNSAKDLAKTCASMRRKYPGELTVQEFIPGEDVTVSVYGNKTPVALAPWRLSMGGADQFATERIKFNSRLRRKKGIRAYRYQGQCVNLLKQQARKLYVAFDLSGYARLDFRMTPNGKSFFIDVNANPNIAAGEDFASAARFSKFAYVDLIEEIVRLARNYKPRV